MPRVPCSVGITTLHPVTRQILDRPSQQMLGLWTLCIPGTNVHQLLDGGIVDTAWLSNFESTRSKVTFERLQESTKNSRVDFSDDLRFTELFIL